MHVDDSLTTHRLALRAARRLGNRHAEATTLYGLGLAYLRLRDHRRAIHRCARALRLYREVGDQYRASSMLTNLALAHHRLGQYLAPAARGEEALLVARDVCSRPLEAAALYALAHAYLELGRHDEALAHAQHALAMWRATGNRDHEAADLTHVAGSADEVRERLRWIRDHEVPAFLDAIVEQVPWHEVRVVGFSSTFQQNTASFALARRLKERYPNIVTVFGGANFDGEMGLELVRSVQCIDFAGQVPGGAMARAAHGTRRGVTNSWDLNGPPAGDQNVLVHRRERKLDMTSH